MDDVRRAVALITIVAYPPVIIFWLLVHPIVWFWRKRGLVVTYTANLVVMAAVGWGLYSLRGRLLALEYGTNRTLIVLSAVAMVVAAGVEVSCRRQLKASTMVGVPELQPGARTGR